MTANSHINNKRIAKNTLALYFRMLFMMVISLYTSRVILRTLGVDDFGIFHVVGGIVMILGFLNTSMAGATQRFLNFELGKGSLDDIKRVLATSLRLHWFIGVAIAIVCETIGLWYLNAVMVIPEGRIVAANWVFQFSVLTFFVTIISVPYNSVIIAHEKMSVYAYISILEAILKLGAVFLLTIGSADRLILYALLNFLIAIILRIIYSIYSYKVFPECRNYRKFYNKSKMHEMLGFSGWTVMGALGSISHTQGVAMVINYFFGVTVNAAQGIANQVNHLVTNFVTNFMTASNPQLVKSYAAGDISGMRDLLKRSSKMALFMVSFFSVPLIIEMPFILKLWLGQFPENTVIFARIILLTSLCNSFASPLSASMGATGNIKTYQLILTTLGWLHIPLAIVCFVFGAPPVAAMFVYLILVIIMQNVRVYMVGKVVRMTLLSFYREVILRAVMVFGISLGVSYIAKAHLPVSIWSSFVVMALSGVLVLLFVFAIGFSKTERIKVTELFLKKLKKR